VENPRSSSGVPSCPRACISDREDLVLRDGDGDGVADAVDERFEEIGS
jgi:hypothetical protein